MAEPPSAEGGGREPVGCATEMLCVEVDVGMFLGVWNNLDLNLGGFSW